MFYFKLLRFYPSLTMEQILAMTPQQTKYYLDAMEKLKAEEQLESMEAAMYPHSNKVDRTKIHKKWKSKLKDDDVKVVKTTDLQLI